MSGGALCILAFKIGIRLPVAGQGNCEPNHANTARRAAPVIKTAPPTAKVAWAALPGSSPNRKIPHSPATKSDDWKSGSVERVGGRAE